MYLYSWNIYQRNRAFIQNVFSRYKEKTKVKEKKVA